MRSKFLLFISIVFNGDEEKDVDDSKYFILGCELFKIRNISLFSLSSVSNMALNIITTDRINK